MMSNPETTPERVHVAPPFPTLMGLQFYAKDSDGQWFYVNHGGQWHQCPPPVCQEAGDV